MIDLKNFDPNAAGNPQLNIFGLPFSEEEAQLVIQPVPWEATIGVYPGTARCIESVMRHSIHIDLHWKEDPTAWKKGIHMREINNKLLLKSDYLRKEAELLVDYTCRGQEVCQNSFMNKNLKEINAGGLYLNEWIYDRAIDIINKGKIPGLLGGDHSISQGIVKALGEKHDNFAILQIDAHCELRKTYEGFHFSHACVMRNILEETPQVEKLIQVATRDYCEEEFDYLEANKNRIKTFFDDDIKDAIYEGKTWRDIAQDIVNQLPELTYLSLDIDGLDPKYCPSTNTPVIGGLEYSQISYLLKLMRQQNKKLIGFDLCQIGNGRIGTDAQNGAYILWDLCNQILKNNYLN
ncbi:arginase family protein [Rhizosphaericola mali]|uniref:Agmatinase n=1 Tax=Rhizosphaericola mali TaxID=2545455 RepID=A0A5P2FVA9_9BACT|nr:arginase family protein [Rhizosphaericola mali]QES87426.1 agmatinase [Rhizosphaericola mali]